MSNGDLEQLSNSVIPAQSLRRDNDANRDFPRLLHMTNLGHIELGCAALTHALDATPSMEELPVSLPLAETSPCWIGPEAPALIRLLPLHPNADASPRPLLWIHTVDSGPILEPEPLSAPVVSTPLPSSVALTRIQNLVAAQVDLTRPGTLVRVHGSGVLLQGDSGTGKSETALTLLERGHPLVTDDAVRIQALPNGELLGSAPGSLDGQLAVHGLGLLKVNQLFGETAVISNVAIQLIVALTAQAPPTDPLQGAWTEQGWLGQSLPRLALSTRRPQALLIETAVRQIQAQNTRAGLAIESVGESMPERICDW